MKFQAIFTVASLIMAASAQDKLNCGAEIRIYNDFDCKGVLMEGFTLNGNGHTVKTKRVYGSPYEPKALSVGWDKAANTLLCLGNTYENQCDRILGESEPAYDSQCMSLEPGCEKADCWEVFGRLFISQAICSPDPGFEECGFSANW